MDLATVSVILTLLVAGLSLVTAAARLLASPGPIAEDLASPPGRSAADRERS